MSHHFRTPQGRRIVGTLETVEARCSIIVNPDGEWEYSGEETTYFHDTAQHTGQFLDEDGGQWNREDLTVHADTEPD